MQNNMAQTIEELLKLNRERQERELRLSGRSAMDEAATQSRQSRRANLGTKPGEWWVATREVQDSDDEQMTESDSDDDLLLKDRNAKLLSAAAADGCDAAATASAAARSFAEEKDEEEYRQEAVSRQAPHRAEGGTEPYKSGKKLSRMACEICRQKRIRCVHDVTAACAAARSYTTNVQGLAKGPTSFLLASAEAASSAAVAGAEEKEGEDTSVRRGWGQGGGMVEETMSLQEKGWERRSRKGMKHHYEYIAPDGETFENMAAVLN